MRIDQIDLAAGSSRRHSLDAVRAAALLLGVLLHATMSFLPGPRIWMVADVEHSVTLALLLYVVHIMRMVTFFLLAGFVARLAMHRMGAHVFFRDRLRRIGLVLVAAWPILFALIVAGAMLAAHMAGPAHAPPKPPRMPAFTPTDFPLAHLWFLWVLLLLYAGLALAMWAGRGGRAARVLRIADAITGLLLRQSAPLLLAAPLCASFYFYPDWHWLGGIPTPDRSLIPQLPAAVAYGGAFALGWMVQRQPAFLDVWERRWVFNLVLSLALTMACLGIAGKGADLAPVAGTRRLAYAACYSMAVWSWAFALVGMAQRFWSGYSPLRRYLADASYFIYLVHLPLLIVLQALVSQLAWPWQLKYPLIVVVAFALMLAAYSRLVRGRLLGAWLNGARKRGGGAVVGRK